MGKCLYSTSTVVTLSAGSVNVIELPLTGICPTSIGCIGDCPDAAVAVI